MLGLKNPFKKETRSAVTVDRRRLTLMDWINNNFGSEVQTKLTPETSHVLTTVWRAIEIISQTIASLPVGIHLVDDGNKNDKKDPLYRLLNSAANPYQNSYYFKETLVKHLMIYGNAYALVVRDGNTRPKELRIIDSRMVIGAEITPDGVLRYILSNEAFITQKSKTPSVTKIDSLDILHLRGYSYDGLWGISPIQAHSMTLGVDLGTLSYSKNLYKNGAFIRGAIMVPTVIPAGKRKELKKEYEDEYAGVENASKLMILEAGAEYKPITMSPAELDWIKTRENAVMEVARIYGVPRSMLESSLTENYRSIEHRDLQFTKYTLRHYLEKIEQEIMLKCYNDRTRQTRSVQFNMRQLYRGDLKSQAEMWTRLFNIAAISPNEIREEMNMPHVPHGDKYYIQANNYADVDRLDEITTQRTPFLNNKTQGDEEE